MPLTNNKMDDVLFLIREGKTLTNTELHKLFRDKKDEKRDFGTQVAESDLGRAIRLVEISKGYYEQAGEAHLSKKPKRVRKKMTRACFAALLSYHYVKSVPNPDTRKIVEEQLLELRRNTQHLKLDVSLVAHGMNSIERKIQKDEQDQQVIQRDRNYAKVVSELQLKIADAKHKASNQEGASPELDDGWTHRAILQTRESIEAFLNGEGESNQETAEVTKPAEILTTPSPSKSIENELHKQLALSRTMKRLVQKEIKHVEDCLNASNKLTVIVSFFKNLFLFDSFYGRHFLSLLWSPFSQERLLHAKEKLQSLSVCLDSIETILSEIDPKHLDTQGFGQLVLAEIESQKIHDELVKIGSSLETNKQSLKEHKIHPCVKAIYNRLFDQYAFVARGLQNDFGIELEGIQVKKIATPLPDAPILKTVREAG